MTGRTSSPAADSRAAGPGQHGGMDEQKTATLPRRTARGGGVTQRALRAGWWTTAVTFTVGAFVALDRAAWVDGLAEPTQNALRIATGAALIALAGLLDPWGSREEPRD